MLRACLGEWEEKEKMVREQGHRRNVWFQLLLSRMNAITNWEEVPLFDSEQAEAAFWAENRVDLRLMETSVAAGADSSESVTITLRLDPRMLSRIKRLARMRYLNYQSMIKQWMSERLEGEFRERNGEGRVGNSRYL